MAETPSKPMDRSVVETQAGAPSPSIDALRPMIDAAPVPMRLVDPTGRCLRCNRAWLDFTGLAADRADGDGWLAAVHADDRATASDIRAPMPREYRLRRADGEYRWLFEDVRRVDGARGIRLAVAMDVSERRWRQHADEDDLQRFRIIAEHTPGVVYSYDFQADGRRRLHHLGPGLELIIGPIHAAEVRADFDRLFELVHADDREAVRKTARERARTGDIFDVECRLRHDDGDDRWVRSVSRPLRLPDGIVRWHVVLTDISEQKRAAERHNLLMHELDHRVKNNMAAVLTLADQTIRTARTLEDFRTSFTGRIQSMARTHEALARQRWTGVEMAEAIKLTLEPYTREDEARVRIEGPRCLLPSRVALSFGLVLHELATNAAKYGALHTEAGHIELSWDELDGIRFRWHEHGVASIEAAPTPGYGMNLIKGLVEREIGGRATFGFEPDGARIEILLPTDDVEAPRRVH